MPSGNEEVRFNLLYFGVQRIELFWFRLYINYFYTYYNAEGFKSSRNKTVHL